MSDSTGLHLAAVPDPPGSEPPLPPKPRLKKLRLALILVPLALLAIVSTVFGMMMAVASDLPQLEQLPQIAKRQNSVLVDVHGNRLATLTSNEGRIIVSNDQIGPYVKYAVIAIEDQRFYENSGVDLRGIGRAFVQDVIKGRSAQGGSTIAQQFVKNALKAQDKRTVFEKLREAALAYHLTRKWSKDRILTEYLNSIYFGNGAYGIEAAARIYFGADPNHQGCGTPQRPCAKELTPAEAATLAAIIASPSAYDPIAHPVAARARRNLVLRKMLEQGRLTRQQYRDATIETLGPKLQPPRLDTVKGSEYFVSWVRQSLVDQVGAQRAFEGNLRVRTTLDVQLQQAAQQAVNNYLAWPGGPTASLVAIDNQTGEVRAMIGGRDYGKSPFNLATQGQRQPGSSIKPFILARALADGISPGRTYLSRKRVFDVPGTHRREKFVVNNFNDSYSGISTVANALTFSDNAVFAALGIEVGTKRVASLAEKMGIRTPVSSNLAMTLGGLKQGVTPLDMAHAYETFATGGRRITGTLGTADAGPVGIRSIDRVTGDGSEKVFKANRPIRIPVLKRKLADLETELLTGPVKYGSATRAQYGGFAAGKTGTTENSGDAWFVGFTKRWTIAVWVGYPDKLKPMETEFGGKPVTGGTFPALIWHDFVIAANTIYDARANTERAKKGLPPKDSNTTTAPTLTPAVPVPPTATPGPKEGSAAQGTGTGGTSAGGTSGGTGSGTGTGTGTGTGAGGTGGGGGGTGGGTTTPATPAPAPQTTPSPTPSTPPAGGGGTGGGTGGTGGGTGAGTGAATPTG